MYLRVTADDARARCLLVDTGAVEYHVCRRVRPALIDVIGEVDRVVMEAVVLRREAVDCNGLIGEKGIIFRVEGRSGALVTARIVV